MKTYVVGGAVRDDMLGLAVKDRDYVVVGATPEEMARLGFKPVGFTNRNEKSVARGRVLTILAGNNTIAQAKWRNTG